MREKRVTQAKPEPVNESSLRDDDVIRIEDLAPPTNVKGGRKILLGEILTPLSNPWILPGS
jgi:hypothetical protein